MSDDTPKHYIQNIQFVHAGCVNFFGLVDEDDVKLAKEFTEKIAAKNHSESDVKPLDMRIFDELKKRGF